jgi:FkbM family methyltransferase
MLDTTIAYGLRFLFPQGDTAVGRSLRDYGEFARPELDLIADYLKSFAEPGSFIDVGANIGAMALPTAARFPRWRVQAFEAHRGLSQILAANAFNNGLYNVEAHHAAIGDKAGLAQFPAPALSAVANFGSTGFAADAKGEVESVRMTTLDEIASRDTRFVKVDVEGFEPRVLQGAERLLREVQPIWLLEASPGAEASRVATLRVLLGAGYRAFWFLAPFATPAHRKPNPQAPKFRSDLNVLALAEGDRNLWQLTEIGEASAPCPTTANEFAYLARYGYRL